MNLTVSFKQYYSSYSIVNMKAAFKLIKWYANSILFFSFMPIL